MRRTSLLSLLFLFSFCMLLSGCELLTLPFQLVGSAVGLAGNAMSLAGSLPMPPPWVFF
jgi:predicted small secreted protein